MDNRDEIHLSVESGHRALAPLLPDTRSPLCAGGSVVRAVFFPGPQIYLPVILPCGPGSAPGSPTEQVCPLLRMAFQIIAESPAGLLGSSFWGLEDICLGSVRKRIVYIYPAISNPTEQHAGISPGEKALVQDPVSLSLFLLLKDQVQSSPYPILWAIKLNLWLLSKRHDVKSNRKERK